MKQPNNKTVTFGINNENKDLNKLAETRILFMTLPERAAVSEM